MRISCIQTNPQLNLEENIEFILEQTQKAQKQGSELVIFPEMFSHMGDELERKRSKTCINEGVFAKVKAAAKELNISILAGSIAEKIENNSEKIYNTSVFYYKTGEIISTYRKQHLFNLKDKDGKKLYCESDTYEGGQTPVIYDFHSNDESWKALTIICYDLRFPEIIRQQKEKIDILFVPAAFTWQTGKDHWEILLRARAIENQCYVVACNQTGYFQNNEKRNYGNTMIIDPWGNIVARLGEECAILTADVSKEKINESRQRLPALHDRKIF